MATSLQMSTSLSSQWSCIICTYLNGSNLLKCELCLTAKPILRSKLCSLKIPTISIPQPPPAISLSNNSKNNTKSFTSKPKPNTNKKHTKTKTEISKISKSRISNKTKRKKKSKARSRTLSNFFFSKNPPTKTIKQTQKPNKLLIKHSRSNILTIDSNLAKVIAKNNKNASKPKTINISLPERLILYKLPSENHGHKTNINGNTTSMPTNFSSACSIYSELNSVLKIKSKSKSKSNYKSLKSYEKSIQKHESILLEILKYDINNTNDSNKVIDTIINAKCEVLCNFLPLIAFTIQTNIKSKKNNNWKIKNKILNKLYDRIVGQSDLRQALIYFIHSYSDIDNVKYICNQLLLNNNKNNNTKNNKYNCIEFWNKLLSKKQIRENDSFNIESNIIIRDPIKQLSQPIKKIIIRKIINSNSRPLLIDCYCGGNKSNNNEYLSSTFILKYGDDLRKDRSCMLIFKWINHLLYNSNNKQLKLIKILTYNVIPMGKLKNQHFGCIQLIHSCIPLRDIGKLNHLNVKSNINNLILTAAGSVISSYIMGVRDRHFDNILIRTTDYTFFNIDYNFILGDKLNGLDANVFGITKEFYDLLGIDNYNKFIELSCNVFLELRHNYKQFINFSCLSFSFVYCYESITKHIYKKLRMNQSDIKAIQWLKIQLKKSPFNKQTKLKNVIHKIATR